MSYSITVYAHPPLSRSNVAHAAGIKLGQVVALLLWAAVKALLHLFCS